MAEQNLNPRFLRILVLLALSVLLLPVSGWFVFALTPLAIHVIVGVRLTAVRDIWKACFAPTMMLFPLCLAMWIRSYRVMSYAIFSVASNEFVGAYIFPGVVEVGWYKHDPAGLKFLEQGVTPDIAAVMTDEIRRFQTFEGSNQVFDCFCIAPTNCRNIPVVEGWFSLGTIYAGLHPDGWTPGSFYSRSGPWTWGSAHQASYVGFHFLVPVLLATFFFVRGIRRLRIRERRLRQGLCSRCGYDLTGNVSGVCPECAAKVSVP